MQLLWGFPGEVLGFGAIYVSVVKLPLIFVEVKKFSMIASGTVQGGSWKIFANCRTRVKDFKEQIASYFPALVECCRNQPEPVTNFGGKWLKCVIPGLRSGELKLKCDGEAQLLEALSAYHEFEVEKLKVVIANPSYNPSKHTNYAMDEKQLVYLCDRSLHFLVCDRGYFTKVRRLAQRNRIHQTSAETLRDPDKIEALLASILGS